MPKLIRFISFSVIVFVVLMTLLRLAFWFAFASTHVDMSGGEASHAFYLGFKFDLRCALLIVTPLAILGWNRFCNPVTNHKARLVWLVYFSVCVFLLLLIYGLDFGHYDYLASRLDASALRFLQNPYESFGVVWSSYPVLTGLALLLAASYATHRIFRHHLESLSAVGQGQLQGTRKFVLTAVFAMVFVGGIYGKLSYYPLRWSDAFFSTNSFISSLALNPVLYFNDTFKNRELRFDIANVRKSYDLMAEYLGIDQPNADELSFVRATPHPGRELRSRPNIVIVMLESYASHKTGVFGNPLHASPNFDELAIGGAYFSRFYAPHIGTARAVFASFFGLPDIEVNQTSSRNPLIVDQKTLFNAFQDYEKYYFLGGSASWANIRAMLGHNIPQLHIYEEGSYSAERVDVWGISDLHMLEEANAVFAGLDGAPFAAFVHLSGNHPPYNIPDDNRGFESIDIADEEVSKFGFSSAKEFNSYRFMDHSLGVFFELARKQDYFENTIFVLYGDNGAPNSSEHQAAGERVLELTRYQTPLLVFAPGMIEPEVIDTVASTVDVLPTVVGLLGLDGVNTTIGRDLFDSQFDDSRYALTVSRQGTGHRLGLVGSDYYYLVGSDGESPRLHRIYANNPGENLIADLPDIAEQYQKQAFAIYETVKFMRYHNN